MTTTTIRRTAASLLAAVVASLVLALPSTPSHAVDLIVGLAPGATAADLDAGTVVDVLPDLGLVLVAGSDADAAALAADPDVAFVSDDGTASPSSDGANVDDGRPNLGAAAVTGARDLWARGLTGAGQTVALIDTGVSDHPDLAGRIDYGPDFSGEGTTVDSFGHGTVMAGIIAGDGTASGGRWAGIAPEARILSVKAAGANGVADVSQILVSIQWVVTYRDTYGVDVLVLAYSNDSRQSAKVDPLAYALQRAHDAGIVVVASAGNMGDGHEGTISGPGSAPAAITVGAYDSRAGDVALFSGVGPTVDGLHKPELVAPGVDIVAPVDGDSTIAAGAPRALRGQDYIRGSGTSQAAAIVGGVAALARQAYPGDDAATARTRVAEAAAKFGSSLPKMARGNGLLDVRRLFGAAKARDLTLRGTGTGSLQGARGTHVVRVGDRRVEGEVTVLGTAWDGATWAGSNWDGSSWDGATWAGSSWDGATWAGSSWDGATWAGSSWDGATWAGSSWDGSSWDGSSWDTQLWN